MGSLTSLPSFGLLSTRRASWVGWNWTDSLFFATSFFSSSMSRLNLARRFWNHVITFWGRSQSEEEDIVSKDHSNTMTVRLSEMMVRDDFKNASHGKTPWTRFSQKVSGNGRGGIPLKGRRNLLFMAVMTMMTVMTMMRTWLLERPRP